MGLITISVGQDAVEGARLDWYCAQKDGTVTRSRLKNGATSITVNGAAAKLSRIVRPGDEISVTWEDPPPENPIPENIPLDVLYEDPAVTVVNKKQGMVTHPGAGNWTGTLVHALLWRWGGNDGRVGSVNGLRPGIVHRLDKDTSGVIITARTPESLAFLQREFAERRAKKTYVAILRGVPARASGEVKTQILRDPKNRKRFTWSEDSSKGRFAHTSYRVVATYGNYSLVRFALHTGRTHQIRVHCKYLGCPILGDPIYGKSDSSFPGATLMLHAKSLTIAIPEFSPLGTLALSRVSTFQAPIPLRFKKVMKSLKERYPR